MDPLESLMRPLASVLNRSIADSLDAQALCRELDAHSVEIRVRDTSLAVVFQIHTDSVELAATADEDADARITGSIPGLARLATGGDADSIRKGDVQLEGDINTVQNFQKLLKHARPDPEEELSRIVGDAAANRIGNLLRDVRDWGRQSADIMRDNVREYLQEEAKQLPTRYEVEQFGKAVNTLRDDVDRLAARLDRLGERAS